MLALIVAAAMGQATDSIAQVGPKAALEAPIVKPSWVGKPSGMDMARVYPLSAQKENLEGHAIMQCRASAAGGLVDCNIGLEEPKGAGFAEATLKLAPLFKMLPLDADQQPVAGRPVRIPVRWMLPGGRVTAKAATLALPGVSGHVEIDCRVGSEWHFDNCWVLQSSGGAALSDAAVRAIGTFKAPERVPRFQRIIFPIDVVAAPTSGPP